MELTNILFPHVYKPLLVLITPVNFWSCIINTFSLYQVSFLRLERFTYMDGRAALKNALDDPYCLLSPSL